MKAERGEKEMPKFFVTPQQVREKIILLEGEDAKHIKTVLRSKVGETITICDGNGMDYHCKIMNLEDKSVEVEILEKFLCEAEPTVKITLFQGLPKADKMELIIQKCVELGVDRIVAVSTERSIVKLDKKEGKKIERWQKIAEAAAKQSGRGKIPEIGGVLTFSQAVAEAKALDGAFIPYEKETEHGLRQFVSKFSGKSIGIFIGPEGGFGTDEIEKAMGAGILPATLGKRILRTETAGMVTVALLLYELE